MLRVKVRFAPLLMLALAGLAHAEDWTVKDLALTEGDTIQVMHHGKLVKNKGKDTPWRDSQGVWHGVAANEKIMRPATSQATVSNWLLPENVSELNTSSDESGPCISADGLSIIFSSSRSGGSGNGDLWQATRVNRSAIFGAPVNLGNGVNTRKVETQPTVTQDGLEIFFIRSEGSWSTDDLYRATRISTSQPFSGATALTELNTTKADAYPCISPDGLTLYFTSDRDGTDHIWFAVRASRTNPFGPAQPLQSVNSENGEMAFSIRADGLAGYFARESYGNKQIYETRRASTAVPFGSATLIRALVNTAFSAGPSVTADGSELYFFSYRAGGRGMPDLWRSRFGVITSANHWHLFK